MYAPRLRRPRHRLQDRGDHVRGVPRPQVRAAAFAQADGAGRDAREEIRKRILRLLLESSAGEQSRTVTPAEAGDQPRTVIPTRFRGIFRDDDLARSVYSEPAGIARAMPTAVAVPADVKDVTALVKWTAGTRTARV